MLRNTFALSTAFLVSLSFFSTAASSANPVTVHVTSDNAYRFALGTQKGIADGSTKPVGPMNKYWFADAWNSNSSQISNAESYPNSNPFKTLTYDYFYIACYGGYGVTTTYPYADIVVVIDESNSMQHEQVFTQQLIYALDATLAQHGIGDDAQNRYGLVGFGSDPKGGHTNVHPVLLNQHKYTLVTKVNKSNSHGGSQFFGTPAQYAHALKTLKSEGGNKPGEDGYAGIISALHYPWRKDAKKIIILVTDENRDDLSPPLNNPTQDYNQLLSALQKHEVTLNTIVYCDIRDNVNSSAMAIDANNTVFLKSAGATYTPSPGGSIKDDLGPWGLAWAWGTVTDYANLAFATGGLAGDFKIIEDYGTPNYAKAAADSFANLLASQITAQSIKKNPYRGVIAEVVDANSKAQYPFDLQAAKWEVYATGSHGNPNGIWSASNPPSITDINGHISNANNVSNLSGTSKGWVDEQGWVLNGNGQPAGYPQGSQGQLVTGEQNNSNSGYFKLASPMDPATRWMWYNPDPLNVTLPFETGLASMGKNNGASEFLIFRLRVVDLRFTRRSSDDPRSEDPRSEDPRSEDPRSEDPRSEDPRSEDPRSNDPRSNDPRSDDPRSNDPRSDDPRSNDPRSDDPRPDKPRSNSPRPVLVSPNSARSNSARSNSARSNSTRSKSARSNSARSNSARSNSARSSSARSSSARSSRSAIRRPVKLRPVDRRPRTVRPAASTATTRTKSADKNKKSRKPLEDKATSKKTVKKKARRAKGAKN